MRDSIGLVTGRAIIGQVTITHEIEVGLPTYVIGDSFRLRQVILNLVSNAVKFTPPEGRVEVRVSRAGFSSADPAGGHRIRIGVRDTGIGMKPEALAHVFDRFSQADTSTTRRYGGSGLGLAICSRLVALMGGELKADSAPDLGSLFHFEIPLRASDHAPHLTITNKVGNQPLNMHVLVVEDNTINLRIISAQLDRLSCTYLLATDGLAALAHLQTKALPQAILMDCHMPNLDGWETTRRIRSWARDDDEQKRQAATLPIIALTAAALPQERLRCLDAGMNDFIAKPVKLAELRSGLFPYAKR